MNFMTEKDVLILVDKVLGKKGIVHKRVEKMEKEIEDKFSNSRWGKGMFAEMFRWL